MGNFLDLDCLVSSYDVEKMTGREEWMNSTVFIGNFGLYFIDKRGWVN